MDMRRLNAEANLMRRVFPNFSLWQDDDRNYYWEGVIRGVRFRVKYNSNYPHEQPRAFDEPRLQTGHRYLDASLCLMEPGQWSANYTAATVVGEIFRFMDENQRGVSG